MSGARLGLGAGIVALSIAIAGCGSSSGPSTNQRAVNLLKEEPLPVGPGGSNVYPSSVRCNGSGSACTVNYPTGQAENCVVSIRGSDQSDSCNPATSPPVPLPKPTFSCSGSAIAAATAAVGTCDAGRGLTYHYAKPGSVLTLDTLSAQVVQVKLAHEFKFPTGSTTAVGSDQALRLLIMITNRSQGPFDMSQML